MKEPPSITATSTATPTPNRASSVTLDYVVIGHVTRDLVEGAFTIGGTVSYAAHTARAMGCRVGVVTSADPDLALDRALGNILVACSPAAETTTFENVYTANGRQQTLHGSAETLVPGMIPPAWELAAGGVVHLGPVAQECAPALVDAFDNAFVGLTPQGWMRCWDSTGRVSRCRWEHADGLLARADAVVLSEEDVAGNRDLIARYADQTRLLVTTQGAQGCTVYTEGRSRHFPAPAACEVDATGSGDIFAAVFFVWLQRSGDPWEAVRLANCVAANSVTREGLDGTPTPVEITRCQGTLQGR